MQNEKLPAETVPAPLNPAPQIRAAPAARKRQTSERRTAASRANGAKSHGPKTHAGKARSSANSLTHGIYSRGCLIPGECQVTFDRMLSDYMARLQPRDQVEENLVNIMVHSCWRTSRIWHLEKEVMAAAHDQLLQNPDFNNNAAGALSHSARAARAFHDLADQSFLVFGGNDNGDTGIVHGIGCKVGRSSGSITTARRSGQGPRYQYVDRICPLCYDRLSKNPC